MRRNEYIIRHCGEARETGCSSSSSSSPPAQSTHRHVLPSHLLPLAPLVKVGGVGAEASFLDVGVAAGGRRREEEGARSRRNNRSRKHWRWKSRSMRVCVCECVRGFVEFKMMACANFALIIQCLRNQQHAPPKTACDPRRSTIRMQIILNTHSPSHNNPNTKPVWALTMTAGSRPATSPRSAHPSA